MQVVQDEFDPLMYVKGRHSDGHPVRPREPDVLWTLTPAALSVLHC